MYAEPVGEAVNAGVVGVPGGGVVVELVEELAGAVVGKGVVGDGVVGDGVGAGLMGTARASSSAGSRYSARRSGSPARRCRHGAPMAGRAHNNNELINNNSCSSAALATGPAERLLQLLQPVGVGRPRRESLASTLRRGASNREAGVRICPFFLSSFRFWSGLPACIGLGACAWP